MVSTSLPHFSEESDSPYLLRKQHHKRVEAGYLFTLTHNRVLLAFCVTGKLLVPVDSEDLIPHIAPRERGSLLVQDNTQEGRIDVDLAVVLDEAQFLNLFMKKLTRERVVPIISASIACDTLGSTFCGRSCLPYRARSRRVRASRFSLELKSWSIRSSSTRTFRASI